MRAPAGASPPAIEGAALGVIDEILKSRVGLERNRTRAYQLVFHKPSYLAGRRSYRLTNNGIGHAQACERACHYGGYRE